MRRGTSLGAAARPPPPPAERGPLGALALAQPQAAQRVGPQAADPARRRPARGQRAAPAVGAVDRRDHGRDAGALPERGQQPGAVVAPDPAGAAAAVAARGGERLRRGPDVRGEPGQRGLAPRHAVGELVAQRVEPLPGPGRGEQDRDAVEPALAQEPREVGAAGVRAGRRERVGLVEHDDHRRRVAGQRPQLALVERGVGVLLRVDDPHEQVGERDDAVGLAPVRRLDGVEVRQVEEHEPGRPRAVAAVAAGHARASRAARRRRRPTPPRSPTTSSAGGRSSARGPRRRGR